MSFICIVYSSFLFSRIISMVVSVFFLYDYVTRFLYREGFRYSFVYRTLVEHLNLVCLS